MDDLKKKFREEMEAYWAPIVEEEYNQVLKMKLELEQAKQKSKAEGEDKLNALYSLVLGDGRMEDLNRAFTDREYRESLFSEYAPKLTAQGISLA